MWNSVELENLAALASHPHDLAQAIATLKQLRREGIVDRAYLQLFYYHAAWGHREEALEAAQEVLGGVAGKFGWDEARQSPEAMWAVDPETWEGWNSMNVSCTFT